MAPHLILAALQQAGWADRQAGSPRGPQLTLVAGEYLEVEALQLADLPRQGLQGLELVAGQGEPRQLAALLQVAHGAQVVVGQVQLAQLGGQGQGGVHGCKAVVRAGQVLQVGPAGCCGVCSTCLT